MTNSIFLPPNAAVVEILPPEYHQIVFDLNAFSAGQYWFSVAGRGPARMASDDCSTRASAWERAHDYECRGALVSANIELHWSDLEVGLQHAIHQVALLRYRGDNRVLPRWHGYEASAARAELLRRTMKLCAQQQQQNQVNAFGTTECINVGATTRVGTLQFQSVESEMLFARHTSPYQRNV